MNSLPWKERINMLSINPDAATREDVARMAAELSDFIGKLPKLLARFSVVDREAVEDADNYDGGATYERILKTVESVISEGR